jgi:hypothetical protein
VAHAIKPYASIDAALTAVNFPMTARTEEKEYDELISADAQAAQQDRQAQMAIEMAKASKNIQGPVDPNSVLAGMGKTMQGGRQ